MQMIKLRAPIPHQDGKTFWVQLTQGKFARIDKEDAERVGRHNWCAVKKGNKGEPSFYARSSARIDGGKCIEMQRFLWKSNANLDGLEVDHLNFDTLDKRIANLQVCAPVFNITRTMARVAAGKCNAEQYARATLKAEPQPVFTGPLPPPIMVRSRHKKFSEKLCERLVAEGKMEAPEWMKSKSLTPMEAA